METEVTEGLTAQEVMEHSKAVMDRGMDAVCASYKEFAYYKKLNAVEKKELSDMTGTTTDLSIKILRMLYTKYITASPLNITKEDCKMLTVSNLIPVFIKAREINKSILEITEYVKERKAKHHLLSKGYTFKTRDLKDGAELDAQLYDICRATSAGPTYLPTYRFNYPKNPTTELPHRNCIDGGTYVNNPSMAALSEFVKNFQHYDSSIKTKDDIDYEEIFVLSIGTGTYSNSIQDDASANKGELYWAKQISDIMMRGVNKTTDYEMNEIIEDGNYLRLSINIDSPEHAEMSNSSQETTNYLINATQKQVLNDNGMMSKLDAFIKKSGLG